MSDHKAQAPHELTVDEMLALGRDFIGYDLRDDRVKQATRPLIARIRRLRAELREVAAAFSEYVRTHECAGGPGHDWWFVEACDDCKAPDQDCQNYHTVWCPTCLGCACLCGEGEE